MRVFWWVTFIPVSKAPCNGSAAQKRGLGLPSALALTEVLLCLWLCLERGSFTSWHKKKKRIIEVNGIFYVTTVKTLLSQATASFKSLLKNAEPTVLQNRAPAKEWPCYDICACDFVGWTTTCPTVQVSGDLDTRSYMAWATQALSPYIREDI